MKALGNYHHLSLGNRKKKELEGEEDMLHVSQIMLEFSSDSYCFRKGIDKDKMDIKKER